MLNPSQNMPQVNNLSAHFCYQVSPLKTANRYLRKGFLLLAALLQMALLLLPQNSIAANSLPPDFSITYTVSKGIMELGHTTRTLTTRNNGEYLFESITKPSGLAKLIANGEVVERSTWTLVDNYPRPHNYTYKTTGGKKNRDVKLLFNWQKNTVTNIINGDPWKMKLEPRIQDKLLYQLSLMVDLQSGKTQLEYHVADGGRAKTYVASIIGKEVIETELGNFNTVIVQRKTPARITTFWCSPKLHYLPILIEQKKTDGGRVEARMSALTGIKYDPPDRNDAEEDE